MIVDSDDDANVKGRVRNCLQVTQARKKEAKLRRRAERGALQPPLPLGVGAGGNTLIEPALGADAFSAADPVSLLVALSSLYQLNLQ